MFIRKLAFSNFALRKSRVALTVAAVALSVSLVVSVTSGYASLFEAAFTYLNQYMGTTDARLTRQNDKLGVPWTLVEELRKDPNVRHADGRVDVVTYITDPNPKPEDASSTDNDPKNGATKSVHLVGVERPSDRRVDRLHMEAGEFFSVATGDVAVVDQAVAEILHIKVGDSFTLPYLKRTLTAKVVGIVHKPAVLAVHMRTIYLPLHTLQSLVGAEGRVGEVMIDLTGDADRRKWADGLTEKFANYKPPLRLHLTSEIRSQMDQNLQGIMILSYMGSAISMLAAMFIIFSALSMGVTERQRSLAMLRAVGAFRSQIGWLVVFEGTILATLGLLIGVPLGWIWIKILSLLFHDIFVSGAVVSWGGVLFGVVGTLVTALVASLLPAWAATRVSPLEAMSPLAQPSAQRAPVLWALIGLFLISIDPFLFFGPIEQIVKLLHISDPANVTRGVKFYAHFGLGMPGLFVGYFLLAPMLVWLTERIAGPVVAILFGLKFALLRQQLSSGLWRAAGTCAALMVGLAVLISMQINGHTMLGGWKLPNKFPDVFIGTSGLNAQEELQLAQTPGISNLMPITVAAVTYGTVGGSKLMIAMASLIPDSTMFIGIDPDKAFDMMELDFRLGNAADAKARLQQGDWVIVTQEYRNLHHCNIGDEIRLGGQLFHIAGVIWSPGIDVMVGMYDMGDQFEQRTVSSVFGSVSDSRKYFGAQSYMFAAELQSGLERFDLIKRIKKQLNAEGLQVGDVREIKTKIQSGLYHLLALMSTVAFCALAVASLGVMNTVMASVRSRRWQFGVLRSIGVTRDQLLRLVLAEAFLLGLIGTILGLLLGFEMAIDAGALTGITIGYRPPLVIPWNYLFIGVTSVLLVSLAASIWPANEVARAEPLTLLQAGRAST